MVSELIKHQKPLKEEKISCNNTKNDDGIYKLYTDPLPLFEARRVCDSQGIMIASSPIGREEPMEVSYLLTNLLIMLKCFLIKHE